MAGALTPVKATSVEQLVGPSGSVSCAFSLAFFTGRGCEERESREFFPFSAKFQGSNFKYLYVVCSITESKTYTEAVIPSPDLDLDGLCRTELTRTHLETSVMTVHTSKDNSHPIPPSVKSMKWTDQQHSSYLKSLETSFVNQLHHLLVLRGQHSQNNLRETHFEKTLPDQYLVLQDGCCQEISLERTESMLESTADSHFSVGNPLRSHLKNVERESAAYDPGLLCDVHLARNGKSSCRLQNSEKRGPCGLWHPDVAEVSDQNFEDENLGSKSKAKKLKTASDDASSNDQIFPFANFHGEDISTGSSSSSGN